jgi:hypothetical protein
MILKLNKLVAYINVFRAVRILNAELRHKKITFACSLKNTKFYIIGLLVYIFGRYIQSYQMLFNLLPY